MRSQAVLLRLGVILLFVAGGFMGYQSYQEHERNAQIQDEIDALETEAEKIRRENETLAQRIEYFASPDFQEQEAKKKLGLRRQEESVLSIREDPSLVTSLALPENSSSEIKQEVQILPNYKKWWQQFFPPMNKD